MTKISISLPLSAPTDEIWMLADFCDTLTADLWFQQLLQEIEWEEKPITIFGKTMMQPRLVAWYGEAGIAYTYSKQTIYAKPWTDLLLLIKNKIEQTTATTYNSVLLNLYRNGKDSMGWHSDDEKELGINPTIASLSLGTTRDFQLKHKTHPFAKTTIALTHGSLLIMAGSLQHHWQHALPKRAKCIAPRINLTFRKILT